jgi:FKBP-type peptidyl-prolyl cis-trans isomerase
MKFIFFILITFLLGASCEESKQTEQPEFINEKQIEDTLIKANKFLLERDRELIESYIRRKNLNMKVTESGLWHEIFLHTNEERIKPGDIVHYNYTVSLLDGTLCYSSDNSGPAKIKIGQSGKEFGLEEGLLMMKKGEKALFILPPHLAHGLIGDMEKIPARSIIIYEIQISEVIDF